mgnify:CR=1 FL=1
MAGTRQLPVGKPVCRFNLTARNARVHRSATNEQCAILTSQMASWVLHSTATHRPVQTLYRQNCAGVTAGNFKLKTREDSNG